MGSGGGDWQGIVQQAIQSQGKNDSKSGGSSKGGGMGGRMKGNMKDAGKAMSAYGQIESENAGRIAQSIQPVKYHRGGKVRKSGPAVLQRKERVIPKSKRKKVERLMKREGMKLTDKKKRGKKREKSSGR